jgi:CheY-like chemotaxis protein
MDEATLARCFEPLFTTKGPFKGTGLGLASARRLVERSGGVITCASALGAGTTFSIWLPVTPDDRSPVSRDGVTTPSPSPVRARVNANILLCEDDPGLRRLALQVLTRNGFVVLEAVSAEDALDVYSRFDEHIDVLLSDVVLPEMAGPELAAQLQSVQADLLVVMMSGTASSDVIAHLREGSAVFLAKPFKPSELVDQVISLLSRRVRMTN